VVALDRSATAVLRHRYAGASMSTYAFPIIGELRVDLIGTPEVLKVLSSIWLTKSETARRARQRIGIMNRSGRDLFGSFGPSWANS
jgi:hypothetical protein